MREDENMTQDDVLEVISNFPVVPMGRRVIISLNQRTVEEGGLILDDTEFDDTQFVIAVGNHETEIKAGGRYILDIASMMKFTEAKNNSHEQVGHIEITPLTVDGKVYGMIPDRHIIAIDGRT